SNPLILMWFCARKPSPARGTATRRPSWSINDGTHEPARPAVDPDRSRPHFCGDGWESGQTRNDVRTGRQGSHRAGFGVSLRLRWRTPSNIPGHSLERWQLAMRSRPGPRSKYGRVMMPTVNEMSGGG